QGADHGSVQSPPTRKIIKTKRGHTIQFEDAGGEERIIICDGERENRIVFSQRGISITNKNNTIDMTNQGITINGEKKVCLEGLITWLIHHTHVGNLGAPTPLNPADAAKLTAVQTTPDGDILSQTWTLGWVKQHHGLNERGADGRHWHEQGGLRPAAVGVGA